MFWQRVSWAGTSNAFTSVVVHFETTILGGLVSTCDDDHLNIMHALGGKKQSLFLTGGHCEANRMDELRAFQDQRYISDLLKVELSGDNV